jgi:hypothetical protein
MSACSFGEFKYVGVFKNKEFFYSGASLKYRRPHPLTTNTNTLSKMSNSRIPSPEEKGEVVPRVLHGRNLNGDGGVRLGHRYQVDHW